MNQVLGTAALRAGMRVQGLDQTGLSQKAGPVVSHLRFGRDEIEPSNRITPGTADCILAFDMLVAADNRYLGYGDPQRTVTIASTSPTPTGDMVYDSSLRYPDIDNMAARLESTARRVYKFDALAAAEALLGGTLAANFLLVGAAYQSGALQCWRGAIEERDPHHGIAVDANIAAFRWGRTVVGMPDAFVTAAHKQDNVAITETRVPSHLFVDSPLAGETRRLAELRSAHLMDYEDEKLARRYLATVNAVWRAERQVGDRKAFSESVADGCTVPGL